jgi:hypothetical protein
VASARVRQQTGRPRVKARNSNQRGAAANLLPLSHTTASHQEPLEVLTASTARVRRDPDSVDVHNRRASSVPVTPSACTNQTRSNDRNTQQCEQAPSSSSVLAAKAKPHNPSVKEDWSGTDSSGYSPALPSGLGRVS